MNEQKSLNVIFKGWTIYALFTNYFLTNIINEIYDLGSQKIKKILPAKRWQHSLNLYSIFGKGDKVSLLTNAVLSNMSA